MGLDHPKRDRVPRRCLGRASITEEDAGGGRGRGEGPLVTLHTRRLHQFLKSSLNLIPTAFHVVRNEKKK